MKILPIILMLSLVSCGAGTTEKKNKENDKAKTEVAVTDKTVIISEEEFKTLVMDYENFNEKWEYKGELPCIVDFYADWCGPCRRVAPILDELAAEYAGKIIIYKVNVDKARNLSAFFGVQSIPTFIFSPKEGMPAIQPGAPSKEQFVQIIEEFLLENKSSKN